MVNETKSGIWYRIHHRHLTTVSPPGLTVDFVENVSFKGGEPTIKTVKINNNDSVRVVCSDGTTWISLQDILKCLNSKSNCTNVMKKIEESAKKTFKVGKSDMNFVSEVTQRY